MENEIISDKEMTEIVGILRNTYLFGKCSKPFIHAGYVANRYRVCRLNGFNRHDAYQIATRNHECEHKTPAEIKEESNTSENERA